MQATNRNILTRITASMRSLGRLSLVDFLLVYFVIMNFVLAVPTVVFGLFLNGVVFYFMVYSVILFVSFFFVVIRAGRRVYFSIHRKMTWPRNLKALLVFSVMLLWCFYIVLITLYTPIFSNWDAMAIYMNMAKAMLTTGSLVYSPYYLSIGSIAQMGWPPLAPITYAFTLYLIGVSYIKLVPLIYFLFLLLLIFKIGSEFFDKRMGVLLVFLFMLMPSTQTLFGHASLYLDIVWTFYTLASIYFLLRCFRDGENNNLWSLMLGMASGLLLMSKEYGILIFSFVFSLFIFSFLRIVRGRRTGTILAALVAFLPYLFLSILYLPFGVDSSFYFRSSLILFLLLAYSLILLSLNNDSTRARVSNTPLKLILFLLPVGSSMIYLLFNIVVREQITPAWEFGVMSRLAEAGIRPPPWAAPASFGVLSVYNFLIVFPMALLFVPLVVGLLMIYRDRKKGKAAREIETMMIFFISLLAVWGFRDFPIGGDTFRYVIPLSVLVCIIALYDYRHVPQAKWNTELRYLLQFCPFTLAFAYTWFIIEGGAPDNLLFSWLVNTQPSATLVDLFVLTAIFSPYILARLKSARTARTKPVVRTPNHRARFGIRHKNRIFGILFVSALVVNLFMPAYLVYRSSTIISEHTWDPTYYARPESFEVNWHDGIFDVADYYSSSISDSFATVTCGMHRLTYLLQRTFVDLYWEDQVDVLSSFLLSENQVEIVNALIGYRIRYFLLPTQWHYAYSMYLYYYTNYALFKMVTEQANVTMNGAIFSFIHLRSFPTANVELYKLIELSS